MIKIASAYIVYNLDIIDNYPNIPFKNFTFKNCFFSARNIAKDSNKEKWVHRIAFDGKIWWLFDNFFPRYAVIFSIDNIPY